MAQPPLNYAAFSPYYGPSASSWSPLGGASLGPSSLAQQPQPKHYQLDDYAFDPALAAWMSGSAAPSVAVAPAGLGGKNPVGVRAGSPAAVSVAALDQAPVAVHAHGGGGGGGGGGAGRKAVSAEEFTHVGSSTKKWPRASVNSGSSKSKAKKAGQTDIEEEISTQNLYKTELCRSFEETGSCRYGAKCQFAHGREELRPVLRHPKYKTEVCKTFHTIGTCPYGKRCRFIHSLPNGAPAAGEGDAAPSASPTADASAAGAVASPAAPSVVVVASPPPQPSSTKKSQQLDADARVIAPPPPAQQQPTKHSAAAAAAADPSVWSSQWPAHSQPPQHMPHHPAHHHHAASAVAAATQHQAPLSPAPHHHAPQHYGSHHHHHQASSSQQQRRIPNPVRRPQQQQQQHQLPTTMLDLPYQPAPPMQQQYSGSALGSLPGFAPSPFDMGPLGYAAPSMPLSGASHLSSLHHDDAAFDAATAAHRSSLEQQQQQQQQQQLYHQHYQQQQQQSNLADLFAKQLVLDAPAHESVPDESDPHSSYRLSVFSHFL